MLDRVLNTQQTIACSKSKIETRKRCEICSKLTIRTSERRHWRRSGVFIANIEHISHLFLVSIFDFEHWFLMPCWLGMPLNIMKHCSLKENTCSKFMSRAKALDNSIDSGNAIKKRTKGCSFT